METVAHDGRTTAYRRSDRDADGPTLLCVHGSGGAAGVWRAQSRLADRFPVAALDLAGHGESPDIDTDPGRPTLSAYADDVVAVARAVDADVLVGNSLGGAVALWVALERDLGLDGLVLAGSGAKLSVRDDLLGWLDDDFDRAVEFLHRPDRLFHDGDPRQVEASKAALRAAGRVVTARDFRTCDRFDVRNRLAAVGVPALAAVGEHDGLTPPQFHEYLAETMPNGELAIVGEAAHLAMVEQPTGFNAAVAEFLDGSV